MLFRSGLGVAGASHLSALYARTAQIELSLSAATLTVGGAVQMDAAVSTGDLTTTGVHTTTGNITAGSLIEANRHRRITSWYGTFTDIDGTLQTSAQPYVTSLGTLTALASSGNILVNNVISNLNLQTTTLAVVANTSIYANLAVGTWANITGNLVSRHVQSGIGTFANVSVSSIPTPKSVTTKEFVTATVVGFSIGLGS